MVDSLELSFTNETSIRIETASIQAHLDQIIKRINAAANLKSGLQQSDSTGRLVTEIVFVGDKKISALNAQFRGINQPTDVLSFERPEGNADHPASLVISLETAARQAMQAGITLTDEVKTLAGHGLLHVLGYHHS